MVFFLCNVKISEMRFTVWKCRPCLDFRKISTGFRNSDWTSPKFLVAHVICTKNTVLLFSLFAANSPTAAASGNTPSSTTPGATPGGPMQNLFQQMQSNPQLQSSMMQSPFVQQMMQQMMANPSLMQSVCITMKPFLCAWLLLYVLTPPPSHKEGRLIEILHFQEKEQGRNKWFKK